MFARPLILLRLKRPLLPSLHCVWSALAPRFWLSIARPYSRLSVRFCPTRHRQSPPAPYLARPCLLCCQQFCRPCVRQANREMAHKARLKRLITLSRYPHAPIFDRSRVRSNAELSLFQILHRLYQRPHLRFSQEPRPWKRRIHRINIEPHRDRVSRHVSHPLSLSLRR